MQKTCNNMRGVNSSRAPAKLQLPRPLLGGCIDDATFVLAKLQMGDGEGWSSLTHIK
jgi:hypothetical protein